MSADEIGRARREAEHARRRLSATIAELQQRLKPGTLASNAWEGVKDKGGEIADDAVQAVRGRPVAVSAAVAAFTLFLARAPIKSAVFRLFSSDEEEGDDPAPTAAKAKKNERIRAAAPLAAETLTEGASA
jgi:uncharacterized protein DUF3618